MLGWRCVLARFRSMRVFSVGSGTVALAGRCGSWAAGGGFVPSTCQPARTTQRVDVQHSPPGQRHRVRAGQIIPLMVNSVVAEPSPNLVLKIVLVLFVAFAIALAARLEISASICGRSEAGGQPIPGGWPLALAVAVWAYRGRRLLSRFRSVWRKRWCSLGGERLAGAWWMACYTWCSQVRVGLPARAGRGSKYSFVLVRARLLGER